MTTELQNKAWSSLPKEFKEEVKDCYKTVKAQYRENFHLEVEAASIRDRTIMLEYFFGIHNLTSNAEEEEMLTVSRKQVQEIYKTSKDIVRNEEYGTKMYSMHIQILCVLEFLFGSKCLLDGNEDNFATKEPKPAEPKFAKGDMIHCKSFGYEGDYKVLEYSGGPRNCYDCIDKYGAYYRFYESDLEPVEIIIKRKKK